MNNNTIAARLRQHARELDTERGNLLRVRAYRRAADVIAETDDPLAALVEAGGYRNLLALPGIGPHIALAIESLVRTGGMPAKASRSA